MPEKSMGLCERIVAAVLFIVNPMTLKGRGAIEYCNYCGSTSIKVTESWKAGNTYNAKYLCLNCGATATAMECWKENVK